MAKKTEEKSTRVRMTDDQVQKFLTHYAKQHDLKGKELAQAVERCAATRWAALERNAAKAEKPAKAPKAKPAKKKKAAKKAAA